MRKENGYICCLTLNQPSLYPTNEFWFGPKADQTLPSRQTAESFTSNGLRSFPAIQDAQRAKIELQAKPDAKNVEILHIEMNIPENEDDFALLKNKKNLVAIASIPTTENEKMYEIIGESIGKALGPAYVPGTLICTNGRKPFKNYLDAERAAKEINRQMGCNATIATLIIKKLH